MPLPDRRPWIIAHRGVPEQAPENTLKSFALAISQGADLLEIDIHLSADKQLVVIHDVTVDRSTNGHGRVDQLTLKELRTLDAGAWMGPAHRGEKIPRLKEVFDMTADRAGLVIELKHGSDRYAGIERLLVQAIETERRLNDVIVISSDSRAIKAINALNPDIMTLDFGNRPLASPYWLTRKPLQYRGKRFLFTNAAEVEAEIIGRLHDLGFQVLTSVVKEQLSCEALERLRAACIDGIFTERVLKLKRALAGPR